MSPDPGLSQPGDALIHSRCHNLSLDLCSCGVDIKHGLPLLFDATPTGFGFQATLAKIGKRDEDEEICCAVLDKLKHRS